MIMAPLKTIAFLVIAAALNLRGDTGSWKKLADMPSARYLFPACKHDDKIYVFRGSFGGLNDIVSSVEVFTPDK
jgi:hypothetical protein